MDQLIRTDKLYCYELLDGQAGAYLIESTELCEQARLTHKLSRVATAALGRLLSVTALMCATLKGENDSLTCVIKGGGPIGTMMSVGKPDGTVKGYVDNPDVDLERVNGKLPVGSAVGHDGMLTVIKDMGMREPYVGKVRLVSGELGEDFAAYFTVSEQSPSIVSLGVLVGAHVESAGGLIVRLTPGASEDAVRALEARADSFANISATLKELGARGAAEKLFDGLNPKRLSESAPKYLCDCSRERVERALISLGRDEVEQMISEQHGATVDCHFCNRRWHFSEDQLRALIS